MDGASGTGYSELPGWSVEFSALGHNIGVAVDGDRAQLQHVSRLPAAEDGLWHDVDVRMDGNMLTIHCDGMRVINGEVDGYTEVSAATDDWVNHHKIKDLVMNLTPCEWAIRA